MISFDSNSWNDIRSLLDLGNNLKCKYCGKKITKNNVGGVCFPNKVFCNNHLCLYQHAEYWNNRKLSKTKSRSKK